MGDCNALAACDARTHTRVPTLCRARSLGAVSSNIAYRKDGFLITVRRLVVLNYLKSWFLLDFVSSFPLSWCLPPSDEGTAAGEISRINKLLRLVKLGKLLRILKLFKIFDRLAESARFNPASFRLLTLAISLFFMSHLFGCLWYALQPLRTAPARFREMHHGGSSEPSAVSRDVAGTWCSRGARGRCTTTT